MKRVPKFCTIFLIMSILMTAVTVVAAADTGSPELYASEVTAENGSTVTVDVGVRNNPGVTSFRFNVEFDDSALDLINTESGCFDGVTYNQTMTSPYSVMWNDSIHDNNKSNGVICKLTFDVKNCEQGKTYPISISYKTGDILNFDLDNVDLGIVNGAICIPALFTPDSVPTQNPVTDDDKKDTDTDMTYTAEMLKTKSLPEIVEIMDGQFQYGPVYVGDNQFSSLAISNPEKLKGYEFIVHGITYIDFEKNYAKEIENIKAGKYTYDYIYVGGEFGKLNDKVNCNMKYNDLTAIYGNFDCVVAGGKGNVCYSVKGEDGSTVATIVFKKDGLSLSDTSAKAMSKVNPKIETIIVPVNTNSQVDNSTNDTDNKDNEKPNANNSDENDNDDGKSNGNNTVKSPATSTMGAKGKNILIAFVVIMMALSFGCMTLAFTSGKKSEI